jgi:ribulose-phosphate 3-epimerase
MNRPIIVPSILAADFGRLSEDIVSLKHAGALWLHIDVMDGHFVPPITFGSEIITMAQRACPSLLRDVHLMVTNPADHIEAFAKAGAQIFTFHIEAVRDPFPLIEEIRVREMKPGISIKPGTPVSAIIPCLELIDVALVMTVEPGYGGQPFMESSLPKIAELRNAIDKRNLTTRLEVDGGINETTIEKCALAGADTFVAGSFLFSKKDRSAPLGALAKKATRRVDNL